MRSLFSKFMTVQALVALTVVGLLYGLLDWTLTAHINEDFALRGQTFAETLARHIEPHLVNRDLTSVQSVLDAHLKNEDVEAAFVTGPDGQVLAHTFVPQFPDSLAAGVKANVPVVLPGSSKTVTFFSMPVLTGITGAVHVGLSQERLLAATRRMELMILVSVSSVMLIAAVIFAVFTKRLTNPIRNLTGAARNLRSNVRDAFEPLPITTKDEVGQLTEAFNAMAGDIQGEAARLELGVLAATRQLERQAELLKREIAERQQTEKALRESQAALRKTHDELELRVQARTAELARSNAELEQFAYVASHDLKEPLGLVSNYVHLLARRYHDRLDADAKDFVKYAVDGVARMKVLINDLLAFSRVGRGKQSLEPTNSRLALDRALTNLGVSIEQTGAVVTADDLPTVFADPSLLAQLFQNLIGNSIKFRSRETPAVRVSARQEGEQWRFSVSDNGIGIDPQYFGRIFNIFERLHAWEEYPGTGIGLAICKRIVEFHGGRIWVESESGSGATFFFTIPMEKRPEDKEPSAHQAGML